MESVSFDTLTFDHPAGRRPARLGAQLCLPQTAFNAIASTLRHGP